MENATHDSCWDCQDFCIGKTKRRLHDGKPEHLKDITSTCRASSLGAHVIPWEFREASKPLI